MLLILRHLYWLQKKIRYFFVRIRRAKTQCFSQFLLLHFFPPLENGFHFVFFLTFLYGSSVKRSPSHVLSSSLKQVGRRLTFACDRSASWRETLRQETSKQRWRFSHWGECLKMYCTLTSRCCTTGGKRWMRLSGAFSVWSGFGNDVNYFKHRVQPYPNWLCKVSRLRLSLVITALRTKGFQ